VLLVPSKCEAHRVTETLHEPRHKCQSAIAKCENSQGRTHKLSGIVRTNARSTNDPKIVLLLLEPPKHAMNPSTLLSFILAFASSSLLVSPVKADLYQLVLHSNSEAALDEAFADSSAILQDWIDDEPASESLVVVAPGETVTVEGGGARERSLQINTCPNRCSNSGSTYCRSLGCAFCGTSCARRRNLLRPLDSAGRSLIAVEAKLTAALAPYCPGAEPGCELFVKIVKV
jgi:hypothetical protein